MKFVAWVLAWVIFLLSIKPGADAILLSSNDQEISCCDEACTAPTSNAENLPLNSSNNCHCNPFQGCSAYDMTCFYTVITDTSFEEAVTIKKSGYIFPVSSPYITDCWRPPIVVGSFS
ncbi:MAG: hypothetical protein IM577_05230 [Chitinophagaceae bacterium]|jgi:hypothetical protein|nr:hypothetical protein [Chitinophagaceae bacterium]